MSSPTTIIFFQSQFDENAHPAFQMDRQFRDKCYDVVKSLTRMMNAGRVVAPEYRSTLQYAGEKYSIVLSAA